MKTQTLTYKCECCRDTVAAPYLITDSKHNLELIVCKECIKYAYESVGFPTTEIKTYGS